MTLESIYYVTQIVAVGAILTSLIAIYWQQREANKIARVENSAALAAAYFGSMRDIMNNPELAAIFRKVMFENQELKAVEATRILIYFNILMADYQRVWLARQNGLFDEDTFSTMAANTAWYLSKPFFVTEMNRIRATGLFGGHFSAHIDDLIGTADATDVESTLEASE